MSSVKQINQKKYYLEILRVCASLFVIMNHVINPAFYFSDISFEWKISLWLFFLSKLAVPIFLMISGSLLLNRVDDIKKYMIRVFRYSCVILVFTIMYYIFYYRIEEWSLIHFLKNLFGGVTIAYWYLYLYLSILLVLPILQRIALNISKKWLEISLCIILIGFSSFLMLTTFYGIKLDKVSEVIYFICYIGIFFLGYYIEKYVTITKKITYVSGVVLFLLLLIQVQVTEQLFLINNQDYLLLDNRIFPTITLSAICFFVCVKYIALSLDIKNFGAKFISYMGGLTFGIYLLGDLFIYLFSPIIEKYYGSVNTILLLCLYSLFTYFSCALCTILLKWISIFKKLL